MWWWTVPFGIDSDCPGCPTSAVDNASTAAMRSASVPPQVDAWMSTVTARSGRTAAGMAARSSAMARRAAATCAGVLKYVTSAPSRGLVRTEQAPRRCHERHHLPAHPPLSRPQATPVQLGRVWLSRQHAKLRADQIVLLPDEGHLQLDGSQFSGGWTLAELAVRSDGQHFPSLVALWTCATS